MNAETMRELFIKKGWTDPQFEEVPADMLKEVFGTFGTHFITGPVFRMLNTGTTYGNIYDDAGTIIYFDIPIRKETT